MNKKILATVLLTEIITSSIVVKASVNNNSKPQLNKIDIESTILNKFNNLDELNQYLMQDEYKIRNISRWLEENKDKLQLPKEFLMGTNNEKVLYAKSFCRYIYEPIKSIDSIESILPVINNDFVISMEFNKLKYNFSNQSFTKGIIRVTGEENIDITDKVLKTSKPIDDKVIFKIIGIGKRDEDGRFYEDNNFYINNQKIILKNLNGDVFDKDLEVLISVEYDTMKICSHLNITLVDGE